MAKATPPRSGDYLAGVAADNNLERVAAQWVLADVPLKQFLNEALVPYELDEVTRLIIDEHDSAAFAPVSHLTVGDFRNWLLSGHATTEVLTAIAPGLTPEMVAAVIQDYAYPGFDSGCQEMPCDYPLPGHYRPGKIVCLRACNPIIPTDNARRCCRQSFGWLAIWLRRCRYRH